MSSSRVLLTGAAGRIGDYAASLSSPAPDPTDRMVGGGFPSPGFGIDEVQARW